MRFSRSSGPGGQNVNKRSTRVEIWFDPAASRALTAAQKARALPRLAHRLDARGLVHVTSSSARTQSENRARALARLAGLLEDATRPPPRVRRPTKPTRAAVDRRIADKRARAETKSMRRRPRPED